MKIKYAVLIVIIGAALSGCAGMNSRMDCPMKAGVRCESLDQVNSEIDQGVIGSEISRSTTLSKQVNYSPQLAPNPIHHAPLRYGETVMRVWVSPFEDVAGNYHQQSEVFTVVKPSYWINHPEKELDISGE